MSDDTRTSSITAHDRHGFWIVEAYGTAGRWFACSRSLDTALSLAGYASMIGESPRDAWEWSDDGTPYSLTCDEQSAIRTFKSAESVESARWRGTLLTQQPFADDADITQDEWNYLDVGGILEVGHGIVAVTDASGLARLLTPGRVYVDTDGTLIDRVGSGERKS